MLHCQGSNSKSKTRGRGLDASHFSFQYVTSSSFSVWLHKILHLRASYESCSWHDHAMVCENHQLKRARKQGKPYEFKVHLLPLCLPSLGGKFGICLALS